MTRHTHHRVPLARATYQLAHRPATTCPYTGLVSPDYDWVVRYDPDPDVPPRGNRPQKTPQVESAVAAHSNNSATRATTDQRRQPP